MEVEEVDESREKIESSEVRLEEAKDDEDEDEEEEREGRRTLRFAARMRSSSACEGARR